jgi:hypothetical protein
MTTQKEAYQWDEKDQVWRRSGGPKVVPQYSMKDTKRK